MAVGCWASTDALSAVKKIKIAPPLYRRSHCPRVCSFVLLLTRFDCELFAIVVVVVVDAAAVVGSPSSVSFRVLTACPTTAQCKCSASACPINRIAIADSNPDGFFCFWFCLCVSDGRCRKLLSDSEMPVRRGHVAPQNSYIETIIRKFDELSKSFHLSTFLSVCPDHLDDWLVLLILLAISRLLATRITSEPLWLAWTVTNKHRERERESFFIVREPLKCWSWLGLAAESFDQRRTVKFPTWICWHECQVHLTDIFIRLIGAQLHPVNEADRIDWYREWVDWVKFRVNSAVCQRHLKLIRSILPASTVLWIWFYLNGLMNNLFRFYSFR